MTTERDDNLRITVIAKFLWLVQLDCDRVTIEKVTSA